MVHLYLEEAAGGVSCGAFGYQGECLVMVECLGDRRRVKSRRGQGVEWGVLDCLATVECAGAKAGTPVLVGKVRGTHAQRGCWCRVRLGLVILARCVCVCRGLEVLPSYRSLPPGGEVCGAAAHSSVE